jgi:hypothetical protein
VLLFQQLASPGDIVIRAVAEQRNPQAVLEAGRLVGMLAQADVALEAKEQTVGEMVERISQPT